VAGAPASKTQSFTLNVQLNPDFVLSEPTAFPVVKSGHTGAGPIRISSQDGFSASVSLSCTFPTTSCSVSPASVSSFPANPNVAVDGTGLVGSFQLTVTGTSGSKVHSLNVPFNVGSFSVSVLTAPSPVVPGQSAAASLNVTPSFGYTGTVDLSCNVSAIPGATCTLNPMAIAITGSSAIPFDTTVAVPATTTPGNYSVSVTGTDQSGAPVGSAVFSLSVVPFQFTSPTPPQSVQAGQQATYSLNVTPVGGNFQHPVTFSCSNLPAHASCSFNPASLGAGSGATSVVLTISTGESSPSALASNQRLWPIALSMGIAGMLLTGLARKSSARKTVVWSVIAFAMLPITFLLACGGGGSSGGNPPPPVPLPVSITISPNSAFLLTSATQRFTATVSGSSNNQVSWDVNGASGGNVTLGRVDPSGLYTAPATLPTTPVSVRATALADTTKSAAASVTVQAHTPAGSYNVTVTATEGSGGTALSRALTVQLIIQ
jgi:hypothetical protein